MTKIIYHSIVGQKINRLEAITDGVFAICLTLLVLEIKIPHIVPEQTEVQILSALKTMLPKVAVYFMSFLTIGLFWLGHSAQLQLLEKSDIRLTWINLFFLFFISLIPFSTSFLGEFANSKIAVIIYWLNLLLMGLTLYFHWVYAIQKKLVSTEKAQFADKPIRKRILVAQTLYIFASLFSLINPRLSIILIIFIQLYFVVGVWKSTK